LNFCLFCVLISFSTIECQKTKKSGEEIADQLYRHPKECKEPSDGGIWAPLAAGHSCGPPGHDCNYPDQWCSARSSSGSVPQFNCINLSDECKKALQKDDANATASSSTGKPSKTTSSPSTTTKTTTEIVTSTKAKKHRTTTTEEPQTTESDDIETTTVEDVNSEETETTRRTAKPRNRASAKSVGSRHNPNDEAEGGASAEVAAPATDKPAEAPSCKDSSDLCCFWASNLQQAGSECNRNALWMRTNCQKSCGTCGCTTSNFQSCQVKVNVEGCKYLQGSPNFVVVPLPNRGNGNNGNFNFPTVGGNPGPVVVPVGRSFNNGFQQSQRFQSFQNGGPSRVVVPLRAG